MSAIPVEARALPVDTRLDIAIVDGPDPLDANKVGTIAFKLDVDLGDDGCRYGGLWDGTFEGYLMARCALDESKTHGHASCATNAQMAFASMLVKHPRADCSVLDRFGQHRELFLLVGAERADPFGIVGLIQWTPATPILSVFEARPSP